MLQKKLIFYYFAFLLSVAHIFLFWGCASKGIPGGGPVDKTPPEIILSFPPADSINIKTLTTINFEFSESMDESSVANNIFISPPLTFEVEWESDTELKLDLKDSLKNDQTYVVVLGANLKDLRNNKLSASYPLAFSTGSVIDKGKISGKVYGIKGDKSTSVFAFELKSDTLRFDRNKPDYVSQTGNKGQFLLNYLKPGKFRVFVVDDANHNLLIDADFEILGIPFRDVILDSANISHEDLNFYLTKIDTLAPKLTNIRAIHNRQINLRLSEKVLSPFLKNISITDSISSKPVNVLSTSHNLESDNILEIYTSAMDSGRTYTCSLSGFADSSGNIMPETMSSFIAARKTKLDTFRVVKFIPADSTKNVHPDPEIYFEVNLPINSNSFLENFCLLDPEGDTVSCNVVFKSAYEVDVYTKENLVLDQFYTIRADLSKIKNVWGDSLADSVQVRHFKINNGDDYGEVSGRTYVNSELNKNVEISIKKQGAKSRIYKKITRENDSFLINYLPDGIYNLSAFLDKDSSFSYSPGNLFPFQFSEPFTEMSDTVKVRKRWETQGIKVMIPDFEK